MKQSLLVKLMMLAMTTGVVWWISWQAPQASFQQAKTEDVPAAVQLPVEGGKTAPERNDSAGLTAAAVTLKPARMVVPVQPGHGEPLDLNRASAREIEALPGIGAVLAQRVIDYRMSAGGFQGVDDLRQVKGIGAKKLDRLRPLVKVSAPAAQRKTEKAAL